MLVVNVLFVFVLLLLLHCCVVDMSRLLFLDYIV